MSSRKNCHSRLYVALRRGSTVALEGGQAGVQWCSDGERGGEGSEAWRREDSEDERPYPSAGDFYDQRWLATAVSVVFLLCASGAVSP